jgi:uncharacterized membrane protein YidH (DUF202 family)
MADESSRNEENGDNMRTSLAMIRTLEAIRRSKLAVLRTGVSVITIALSLLTILITTSRFYSPFDVLPLYLLTMGLIGILLFVGAYLFYRGLRGMQDIDILRHKLEPGKEVSVDLYCDLFDED